VKAAGERRVHDGFVKRGRYDDGAEVGVVLIERTVEVGVAARFGKAEMFARVFKRRRVPVDRGDDLDKAVGDVGRQKPPAPCRAEPARPHMDHPVRHLKPLSEELRLRSQFSGQAPIGKVLPAVSTATSALGGRCGRP